MVRSEPLLYGFVAFSLQYMFTQILTANVSVNTFKEWKGIGMKVEAVLKFAIYVYYLIVISFSSSFLAWGFGRVS